jgi:hypothetical protein
MKHNTLRLRLDVHNWAKNSEFQNSDPNSSVWSGVETGLRIRPEFQSDPPEFHLVCPSFPILDPPKLTGNEA